MPENSPSTIVGTWRVIQTLTGGIDDREPDDGFTFLWIHPHVIFVGDKWAVWEMPYVIRKTVLGTEIDITRNDLNQSWCQLGIIELSTGTLRICLAPSPNQRPSAFSSTPTDGNILYTAEPSDEPLPD